MTEAEKNLVSKLKSAQERRRLRELCTFGLYVIKIANRYTLPFCAPNDTVAIRSLESMIHDEHIEPLIPELYYIGDYCTIDGKLHSRNSRFIPYQLIASRISGKPECAKGGTPQIKRTIAKSK